MHPISKLAFQRLLGRIHAVIVSRGAAEPRRAPRERKRGAPEHSNVGNHSPNGDSPNLRPRGPFSATSAAPREPIPVFNRMETSQRENRFEVSGAETGTDLAQRRRDAEKRGCGWVESEMRPNLSASASQLSSCGSCGCPLHPVMEARGSHAKTRRREEGRGRGSVSCLLVEFVVGWWWRGVNHESHEGPDWLMQRRKDAKGGKGPTVHVIRWLSWRLSVLSAAAVRQQSMSGLRRGDE